MKTKHLFLYLFLFFTALNAISQTSSNIKMYEKVYTDAEHQGGYERILISTTGSNIKALYNVYFDSMGGRMSCLSGKVAGSTINGISYVFLAGEGGEFYGIEEQKFKIEIAVDKSKIKYYLYSTPDAEGTEMVLTDFKYSFIGGISNLRELPNSKSKILSKVDLLKTKIELIDIGNFEKIGAASNFWYKVKINEVEGWLFGCLSLFKN